MNIKTSHIQTILFPCLTRSSGHLKIRMIIHTHIRVLLNNHWELPPLLKQLLGEEVTHYASMLLYHHLEPPTYLQLPQTTIPHCPVRTQSRYFLKK